MRDADEAWVADLAARSLGLVPDVPVDVASALRGGRRRRTQRRAIGGGALVAVMLGAGLGIPALPRPTTVPGVVETVTDAPPDEVLYAEVVDTIPVCPIGAIATPSEPTPEWQRLTDRFANTDSPDLALDAPEPAQGAVPPDFEPVAAVTCRDATPPESPYVVEAPVRLEGDLGPLLDFLAQPEPVAGGLDPQCVMDYWLGPPELYLVDAAGRAIAPHWPFDRCGRAGEEGFALLAALEEVAIWTADAPSDDAPVAEIVDAVPECYDPGAGYPEGMPREGRVPLGFEPVTVAYCERQEHSPGEYEQVLLEGDLGPLLEFLAQPSPVGGPPLGCDAAFIPAPQVYLIDGAGRVVAPTWPDDGCHPVLSGEMLLDGLEVVGPLD